MSAQLSRDCPKCGSQHAWYEMDVYDVWLRCLCGLMKLIATKREEITTEHIDSGNDVTLPKHGSKLWTCLVVLCSLRRASTQEVTENLNVIKDTTYSVADIASQLTILRYKGLIVAVNKRRGYVGGSTWECTKAAKKLLGG